MITTIRTLIPILLCIPTIVFAVSFKKLSRIEAQHYLREFYTHALVYAADHEEQLPEKVEDLKELIQEDKKLIEFLKDPNFEYHASGKGTWELNGDVVICTYTFPDEGRLITTGWGNTIWEEKEPKHIQSAHTMRVVTPDTRSGPAIAPR